MNSTIPLSETTMNAANSTPIISPTGSAPGNVEPSVTELHQGGLTPLEIQRQLLQQKLAEKSDDRFTSPTDQMMTPCSKKLQDHKKKAFGKTKPMSLAGRFSKVAAESGAGKENKQNSGL
ncbi:hypothetical protein EDC01DRAFT_630886 [Geopyxis carbonaria]|nr:hypothetical protein EDC01DRAFT_630886 [Geopyxis carbonaria]